MNQDESNQQRFDAQDLPGPHEVTQLLRAWSEGDQQALEKLTPLVYAELHRRAHWQMANERSG